MLLALAAVLVPSFATPPLVRTTPRTRATPPTMVLGSELLTAVASYTDDYLFLSNVVRRRWL